MKRALPLFCMVLLTGLYAHAQVRPGQSILWRISGNGLTKPSYLFGTMHVNTKEAFYFKDSLYQFMDRAEAFAMEIHPDSTGQIFQALYEAEDEKTDEKTDVLESIKDIRIDTASLKHDVEVELPPSPPDGVKIEAPKTDSRSLRYLMSRLMGNVPKKDAEGMDVFMDAFLYRLALSGDKKIFGLEHMKVQLDALRSLTSGINVKNMDELARKWDMDDESPLNKYYYKEDIDSIDYMMTHFFNEAALDKFLYKRNTGMVQQMDSIMRKYSLFTAIGTGHLAGSKGVIALLRQKGYLVEPVYSGKKIYAGDVKIREKKNNWTLFSDSNHAFSIEIPGKMTEQAGEAGRMVRYAMDMAGGITYMIISGKRNSAEMLMPKDSFFLLQVNRMLDYGGGEMLNKKDSTLGALDTKQAMLAMKDKSFTRINEVFRGNMFYILFMASMKKETLYGGNANYFLNSLKMLDWPGVVWRKLDLPDDGLRVELPGNPEPKITDESEESGRMSAREFSDHQNGVDYYLYILRPKKGFVYNSTTGFFSGYISSITNSMKGAPTQITDTTAGGCPARYFLAGPLDGQMLEGLIVKRDNVGYYLMTEYSAGSGGRPDVTRFLHSFSLQPFSASNWKTQSDPARTFSTYVPAPFIRTSDNPDEDSTKDGTLGMFTATDLNNSRVYSVEVLAQNAYDWAPDMQTVFDRFRNKVMNNTGNILQGYEKITQGGLEGRDLNYVDTFNNRKMHSRYFLSGKKIFVLEMSQPAIPASASDQAGEKKYFDEFRVLHPEPADWITRNTPDRLFNDLMSHDSLTYDRAQQALSDISFDSTHIRLLMEHSLQQYPVFTDYPFTINYRLFNLANRFYKAGADPVLDDWLQAFIRQHYTDPTDQVRNLQFNWLGMLAGQHQQSGQTLAGELIRKQYPLTDDYYELFNELEANRVWAKTLMPDLLKHITDTMSGMRILSLAKVMIDSSEMAIAELEPYWADIDKACRKLIGDYKSLDPDDFGYDYNLYSVIPLLGYFKHQKAEALLRAFQQLPVLDLKNEALKALFKKNKTVSQAELAKLLAVDNYTVELYKMLRDAGKTSLLPPGVIDQKKMAKGYLWQTMTEDADDEEVHPKFIFIKTIDQENDGVKKRYYLFRMEFPDTDEEGDGQSTESYLAVAGPFDTDPKKLLLDPEQEVCSAYWEEKFDGSKLEEHFKKILEQFQQ